MWLGSVLLLLLRGSAPSPPAAFVDPRDGQSYPLVEIAGMVWFARHLDYRLPGSYCFQDREEACATRGRLYPWALALEACPSGWHLSTEEEWQRVEGALGMKAEEIGQTRGRGAGVGDSLK